MVSTFSARARLELQADGENDNTWGQKANVVFQLIDELVMGYISIDVSGSSDVTLTALNGSSDQSRQGIINLTGTITANIAVIVPTAEGRYFFRNRTSGSFTVTAKTSGGSGVVIPQGAQMGVYCDGTNVEAKTMPVDDDAAPLADSISGNAIDGGTISNFASTGIDDNATGNVVTVSDSSVALTQPLDMNTERVTEVAVATARTDAPNVAQLQDQAIVHIAPASVGGTADAITLTPAPAITAYTVGQKFSFVVEANNTGAVTVDVSSLGTKNLTNLDLSSLSAGAIRSGELIEITYDGTQFQLLKSPPATESLAGVVERATQAETDAATDDERYLTPSKAAAAIWIPPTGAVVEWLGSTAPTGWLLLEGGTIGDAGSGATVRANADTEALYTLIYNSMADAQAPVSGGRGASAAADFAAGKTITLPDVQGRTVIGTGTGSGLTARTHGDTDGAETHQLTESEMPSHTHSVPATTNAAGGSSIPKINFNVPTSETTGSTGGDAAHNNMQPWIAFRKIVKL